MAFSYWLPNDNRIIWAGHVPSSLGSEVIENILVLAGGDILFFHSPTKLSTYKPITINDIKDMKYTDFKDKYGISIDYNTWTFLKNELEEDKIPPYKYRLKMSEYSNMINKYLSRIDSYENDEIKYKEFITIIKIIVKKMSRLKDKSMENKIKLLNELIMNIDKM